MRSSRANDDGKVWGVERLWPSQRTSERDFSARKRARGLGPGPLKRPGAASKPSCASAV